MEPFGLVNIGRVVANLVGDAAVAALATAQHGVVTRAQLRFCGLSEDAIRHRVKQGRLFRLHRGVYQVGHLAGSELTPLVAALLAVGPHALLSGSAALWLWGIIDKRPMIIDVVVLRGGAQSRPGIRVHRGDALHRGEVRDRRDLPVVSPVAALLDLADTGDADAVECALNEGRELKLITQRDIKRIVTRSPGRAGLALLDSLLEDQIDEDFSRKEAERLMRKLIRSAGLPTPRRNIKAHGHELDFYWPELALNVEADGVTWHSSRRKVNRDRERDGDLASRGIQVLRFTWDQLTRRPDWVVAKLAAAIALAQQRHRAAGQRHRAPATA